LVPRGYSAAWQTRQEPSPVSASTCPESKGAETKRTRREDSERQAREELAGAVDQAVATLVAELQAENATDRIRAAAQILDRAWGRPRQAHDVAVVTEPGVAGAREKLAALLARKGAHENGDVD
jgi:hypothetical protein